MTQDTKNKPWSRQYNCCIDCQCTNRKHAGKGLCERCYTREAYRQLSDDEKALKFKNHENHYFGGNRKTVLQRDNYKCTLCGTSETLVVHHIDGSGRKENPNNDLGNLQTLCNPCHSILHNTGKIDTWSRKYDRCQSCGTTEIKHEAGGFCLVCYELNRRVVYHPLDRRVPTRKPRETWAKEYDCCQNCGTTKIQHGGHGLCRNCNKKRLKQLKENNASL